LIWWTPLCRMHQIMTRRFTLYAYVTVWTFTVPGTRMANNSGDYIDGQVMYNWFNNHVNGNSICAEKYKSKGGG
ncbi:autotransporter outer membrane beta-barrel domain-containing protein, partial [Enterobacter bugandensis]|uniref:autotransporter outer membrane beta-barrel domain-containing protein n=1 Tax=Enterobacter bugandensis TaxID=881260 RepID=UPI00066729CB